MRVFCVLLRRELASYFLSLTGYVIIAAITFLTGESFVGLINGLGHDPWPMPVTQMFFGSFYFWMIVLLSAPVLTMRLFALEKATGTFETLMTTPVGDLQVVAANQLHLNPVLFAATNSSGGVLGKMISPQNIATGFAVTNLMGREGEVVARTFIHSIVLTVMLVLLVVIQQYVIPQIIPTVGGTP